MGLLIDGRITYTGQPGYEYGRTREAERGLLGALANPFTPFRRQVIEPEVTTYAPMMDAAPGTMMPTGYTPAEYGEPEFG